MSQPTIPAWGGCPWPVDPACLTDEWDGLDDEVKDRAVALASSTLTRLTGYRVGRCPIVVRPCKPSCAGSYQPAYWDMQSMYGLQFWPHIENGVWVNSCACRTDCACEALCEIALPPPVGRVDEVTVGVTVVNPANYTLSGSSLIWVGATPCPWPTCQDMAAPVGSAGSFAVTYQNSYPVDSIGAYAAGLLAMEFAKACTGGKCRLPLGVTSIARQGVAYDVVTGAFPGGQTGIREIDTYLALWNPGSLRQQPQVWSPDIPSPRVAR